MDFSALATICKTKEVDSKGRLELIVPGFYLHGTITPEIFARLLLSYSPAFHDGHTVADMADLIANSLVISNDAGWLAFTKIVPGVSAELHGARWSLKGSFHGNQAREVIDLVMRTLKLQVLRAKTADHIKDIEVWLTEVGFSKCGYEPLVLAFKGTYKGLVHYSYWGK